MIQPKAQITTISNLPTTSMETALPSTSSATTMLAPEELLNPATTSSLVARSELTPEEAQHLRDRKRKAKKQDRKHLGDMAELYSKSKKGGAKGEKERALQGLVKSGKGVTVVGKSEKELGKSRKRGSGGDEAAREDGKRLKL
jgi:U3 small nucleolar RNA-associated protein MPP10